MRWSKLQNGLRKYHQCGYHNRVVNIITISNFCCPKLRFLLFPKIGYSDDILNFVVVLALKRPRTK